MPDFLKVMQKLIERIKNGETLIADGAMGTMLMQRGLAPHKVPEVVNLEQPEILEEIARLYIEAGSDIIQTNTFGASPLKLAKSNLVDKTKEINSVAVKMAKNAANDKAYVSASVGPSGCILKPYGNVEPLAVKESFAKQIEVLVESKVDAICIETMTDLTEALLALEAAKEVAKDTPVMVTMTFERTPRGFYTIMGTSIERAVKELEDHGADVIGSNCGNGIDNMVMIAKEFRNHSRLPILIQPNAGLPEIRNGKIVYLQTPEFFASKVPDLLEVGVNIIGGCCGTTPEYIAAIREVIKS